MSDETKWAPGPWRVEQSFKAAPHSVDAIDPKDGQNFELCTVWGEDDQREETEMSRANAHLIAAAPTMADALMCWPLNELMGMIEDSGDAAMRERAKWFMEVRDHALAKARGETS